jgi:hypothetical protein
MDSIQPPDKDEPIKKSDRNVCFILSSIYFECVSVIACIWCPDWGKVITTFVEIQTRKTKKG